MILLTTFNDVNNQLKSTTSNIDLLDNRETILMYIQEASNWMENTTSRYFLPRYVSNLCVSQTEYFASGQVRYWLQDEVIEFITDISDYTALDVLGRTYQKPYAQIQGSTAPDALTAFIGFSSSDNPFRTRWQLETAIDDTTEQFNLTNSSDVAPIADTYIRVNNEMMLIESVTGAISPFTVTVRRGMLKSVAVSHLISDNVSVYEVEPDIRMACTRLASQLYTSRQAQGGVVQFADGTTSSFTPSAIPSSVRSTIGRYIRNIVGVQTNE